jgi:5-carboxymethyl-2-hydroxymuconate isomerase
MGNIMPHIVIEYSADTLNYEQLDKALKSTFDVCCGFDCIRPEAVKIRAHPVVNAYYGNGATSFVHVTAHLLEGRSRVRKAEITRAILDNVMSEFPDIDTFSVDALEIDGNVYQKNK